MKKRAVEILHEQIKYILCAKSEKDFGNHLAKIAKLADILDLTGDEINADRLDELIKQAGFWSALFGGGLGGGGTAIWDAIKEGKLKESLSIIAKKALMGAATGIVVDYLIQWLDGIPLLGSYLKELEGADKLRTLLEGVVGGAVAESDIANKLVDKTIDAIENLFGLKMKNQPTAVTKPILNAPSKPKNDDAEQLIHSTTPMVEV